MNTTTDTVGAVLFNVCSDSNQTSITRDGTKSILLWGMQAEEQSFPTSYLPTSGGFVSRNRDLANSSGDTSLINSTEGVLYLELAALTTTNNFESISISDGTNNNRIRIFLDSSANSPRAQITTGGVSQGVISATVTDVTTFNKLAIRYKTNDLAYFVNGVKVGTDTSATIPSGLNALNLSAGATNGNPYQGKVKTVAVYKEFLTDAQLISLTS